MARNSFFMQKRGLSFLSSALACQKARFIFNRLSIATDNPKVLFFLYSGTDYRVNGISNFFINLSSGYRINSRFVC
jgi:hypothetical protein